MKTKNIIRNIVEWTEIFWDECFLPWFKFFIASLAISIMAWVLYSIDPEGIRYEPTPFKALLFFSVIIATSLFLIRTLWEMLSHYIKS